MLARINSGWQKPGQPACQLSGKQVAWNQSEVGPRSITLLGNYRFEINIKHFILNEVVRRGFQNLSSKVGDISILPFEVSIVKKSYYGQKLFYCSGEN